LEVGVDPNGIPVYWVIAASGGLLVAIIIIYLIYRNRKKLKRNDVHQK
jgi:phage shock protein PspC (stress-responsive transcriptional regulator)